MPLSESLDAQALRELNEIVCAGCGKAKGHGRSFCQKCYFKLPPNMRQALYKSFGSGYSSAYDAAKEWLKVNS